MSVPKELEEPLNVGDRRIRSTTKRHDLPEEDAKGPDVRLARVHALEEGFGCHPLDGKPAVCRLAVVLVHVNVTGQAEIGNLEHAVLAHQHVPGGQIPVDALDREKKEKLAGGPKGKEKKKFVKRIHTFLDSRYSIPRAI